MNKIGRGNMVATFIKGHIKKSGDNKRQAKCKSVTNADASDSPAGCSDMSAFAKSLILCGAEASCIEALTGLPKATVAKLSAEAAAEREEEFKAGARALTGRRQGKNPAQRPGNRQSYTGGLLWQKRQAVVLEASGCFATCGMNAPDGGRSWEERRKNPSDRFRLRCGI
jgi:hypothetical protein